MSVRLIYIIIGSALLLMVQAGFFKADPPTAYQITVSAGDVDRSETVVSFTLPDAVEPGSYIITAEGDRRQHLQVDEQNRGWFELHQLEAGASRTYRMDLSSNGSATTTGQTGVSYTEGERAIEFSAGQDPVLSFFHKTNNPPEGMDEVYQRGGYIHPVYTPEGTLVSNHLDTVVHAHHYGIWAAWTRTEFQGRNPDFWNVHNRTGRVERGDSLDNLWQGPIHAGLTAQNFYVDKSGEAPVVALNEEWNLRVFNPDANYRLFDVTVTQTANTMHPLILPQYHYGGMAFRGHQNWDDPANMNFLTSQGFTRENGNETRARWSHMGGEVGAKTAGIAVLGHPDNVRAPQPVRIHPDIPYFTYAPEQLGKLVIEPGAPHVMRYRYVTYDGKPDPELLDQLWNDYAYPPGVTVKPGQ